LAEVNAERVEELGSSLVDLFSTECLENAILNFLPLVPVSSSHSLGGELFRWVIPHAQKIKPQLKR
jgi:hypothetical protein